MDEMVYRDVRSWRERLRDVGAWVAGRFYAMAESRTQTLSVLALCAGAVAIAPHWTAAILSIGIASALSHRFVRRPQPKVGNGIFCAGHDRVSGEEIWLDGDQFRQHTLVIGATGLGKTEALLGLAENPLAWGSGFVIVDGQGEAGLVSKVFAMARLYGREDDVLVLNFMSANHDLVASRGAMRSNTMNPLASASPASVVQMVVSMMDDASSDGPMWKGRAAALMTGIARALCWLRDQGRFDLNYGSLRDWMNFKAVVDLASPETHPDMPDEIRKSVANYLTSLPGFDVAKGYRQSSATLDQHGYLEMVLKKIAGSLADMYGHVFFTDAGQIDMNDVVLNRRILVVVLPRLEQAPDDIANLGRVVVANLKSTMGSILGSGIPEPWQKMGEVRPTNADSPFMVVLDEVGSYAGEGIALMCAQARALGIGLVLSSQDIPAMKRRNEKEAASVIANTSTKIFMRLQEVEQDEAATGDSGEVDRINPRIIAHLKREMGDMTFLHHDQIIQGVAPHPGYSNAGDLGRTRINQFIKLDAGVRKGASK